MGVTRLRNALDDRVLLPPVILAGAILWKLPPAGISLLGLCLALLYAGQKGARGLAGFVLRCAPLTLYWGMMSAVSILLTGGSWLQAWHAGMDACLRILACFVLGGWLCARCGARGLALALEWHLRPFCRDRSWKAGLALAVMLSVFPRLLRSFRSAWEASSLRLARQNVARRASCAALATLRGLPDEAASIGFALAARGLDSPACWRDPAPVPPLHWAAALMICALESALFML